MPHPQLDTYVSQARASGMSDDQIKKSLLGQGWSAADVDAACNPKVTNQAISSTVNKTFVKFFFIFWYVSAIIFFFLALTVDAGYDGTMIKGVLQSLAFMYIALIALPGIFILNFAGSALFAYDLRSTTKNMGVDKTYLTQAALGYAWNKFPLYQIIKYWGGPGINVLLATFLADVAFIVLIGGLVVWVLTGALFGSFVLAVSFILMATGLYLIREALLAFFFERAPKTAPKTVSKKPGFLSASKKQILFTLFSVAMTAPLTNAIESPYVLASSGGGYIINTVMVGYAFILGFPVLILLIGQEDVAAAIVVSFIYYFLLWALVRFVVKKVRKLFQKTAN